MKEALLELVREGAQSKPDFAAIDANLLSPMFKAKILSLYFPERFLAVCSKEHLDQLADQVGLDDVRYRSEIQNRLLDVKAASPISREWSNPKFMRFLYVHFIWLKDKKAQPARKPRRKIHRKVNFEDVQEQRGLIGKKAERFARQWEEDRLAGEDLEHLIDAIDDRTEYPSYGYDFLSHTSARRPRYIEVKAVSKPGDMHRFFLSDNEYSVSRSPNHRDAYYFYLVLFKDGEPVDLEPRLAAELYPDAQIAPASYTVLIDLENSSKKKS